MRSARAPVPLAMRSFSYAQALEAAKSGVAARK
jgi:hypothetical protein